MQIDRSKSLQQLEGEDWGEPDCSDPLITEPYRLHRVPLKDFTVEDLRIMIATKVGLEYLIPIALERLQDHPFALGAHYPYELLVNALGAETRFWQSHPELRARLVAIAGRGVAALTAMQGIGCQKFVEPVTTAYEKFQRQHS